MCQILTLGNGLQPETNSAFRSHVVCENAHMAIPRLDFWSFIIELVTRNPNLGIPPLEDGLLVNLLVFDYLWFEVRFRYV